MAPKTRSTKSTRRSPSPASRDDSEGSNSDDSAPGRAPSAADELRALSADITLELASDARTLRTRLRDAVDLDERDAIFTRLAGIRARLEVLAAADTQSSTGASPKPGPSAPPAGRDIKDDRKTLQAMLTGAKPILADEDALLLITRLKSRIHRQGINADLLLDCTYLWSSEALSGHAAANGNGWTGFMEAARTLAAPLAFVLKAKFDATRQGDLTVNEYYLLFTDAADAVNLLPDTGFRQDPKQLRLRFETGLADHIREGWRMGMVSGRLAPATIDDARAYAVTIESLYPRQALTRYPGGPATFPKWRSPGLPHRRGLDHPGAPSSPPWSP